MSWFIFYLIGFLIQFYIVTECSKYEDFSTKKSKIIYVLSVLIFSSLSWFGIFLCVYGAYKNYDK